MQPVSPIKFVDQIVSDLACVRAVYESAIGLVPSTEMPYPIDRNLKCVSFARPGEEFGIVRLVENPKAVIPGRDASRPHDFGPLALNFRTSDIDAAHRILSDLGCTAISEILEYNVGKPMREVMFAMPSGERLTIIEVGGRNAELPVFSEAIATVGFVVPSMAESTVFYESVLGLTKAIAFQASGAPFDSLLGVERLDRLDFATFTSNGCWTGKVELLELMTETEPKRIELKPDRTGYFLTWFEATDPSAIAKKAVDFGGEIVDSTEDFHIIRAVGGELVGISAQR